MVALNSPELRRMTRVLKEYDSRSTVSLLASLLTLPSLHANTLRIETVLHLAVAYCEGVRTAGRSEVARWLNDDFLLGGIKHLEDPASDVFVTNVETPYGNRRMFEGDWSSNAYYVQSVLDTITALGAPKECTDLHRSTFALLRLSDEVAERLGLKRWSREQSLPYASVVLPSSQEIARRGKALEFTDAQLDSLGVSRRCLVPFILRDADKKKILRENLGHTTLEGRPIVDLGNRVLLAIPSAVSPAIRRYVVTKLLRSGKLRSFEKTIGRMQAAEVERDCLMRIDASPEFMPPPSPSPLVPSSNEWLVRYDENKYIHTILLHDEGLSPIRTEGLCSPASPPQTALKALNQHIRRVAKTCQATERFSVGWSLLVIGGIGRARMLDFSNQIRSWHVAAISIPDFTLLCSEEERPIRRFLKFVVQKRWAVERGIRFGPCTDYDIYSYWRQNGYQFLQRSMSMSSAPVVIIGDDIPAAARKEVRKSMDSHVTQMSEGPHCGVFRYSANSLFDYQRERPVYLSKVHLDRSILAGVVETRRGASWLLAHANTRDARRREFVYEFFRSFIHSYERLVERVESRLKVPSTTAGPLEVRLNLDRIALVEKYVDVPNVPKSGIIDFALSSEGRSATLTLPTDTLLLFNQVDNTGERLVLRAIARGLVSLHVGKSVNDDDNMIDLVTKDLLDDTGARLLHVFTDFDPVQQLLMTTQGEVTFLSSEDYEFSKWELWSGRDSCNSTKTLVSRSECTTFLNRLVEDVWKSLRCALRGYNRDSLVRSILTVHEAAISDRYHWRRTARAVLSLHSRDADVFRTMRERESSRTNIQLPARTLVEMAVCESPTDGGKLLSTWDVDALLAKTRLLLQIATDSDAVYHGLAKPLIKLHSNGEYSLASDFYERTLEPFVSAEMRQGHEKASEEYDRYYIRRRNRVSNDPFPTEFAMAFSVEFGISPREVVECVAELVDWCYEISVAVMETTVGEIKHRLTVNRGLSARNADTFVRSFGLCPRGSWEKAPNGYAERDIWPWRYSRRLSIIARPLVVWGTQDDDKAVFGLGTLVESIFHVMTRAAEGRISQNFFGSPEMLAYLGEANNRLGHTFNREVAQKVRRQGWQVREEVAMTELGAPQTLGDVDILAWTPGGEVQIIECKRLQYARTVAEVAELCRRFRGKENDNLSKHVRRADWIRTNPGCLSSIVGFRANSTKITDRVITNVHVPMTYLTSLPVEPGKIGPLE